MSRRITVAIAALSAALAVCGVAAQAAEETSAGWITAVSGKPKQAATRPAEAKSDRVVKEGQTTAPAPRRAPGVLSTVPMEEPAKVTAPREKEAEATTQREHVRRAEPSVRRVERVRSEPSRARTTSRTTETRQSAAEPRGAAAVAPVEAPKPTEAKETLPPMVHHRNGRPDVMALAAKEESAGKLDEKAAPGGVGAAVMMILKLGVVLALAYLTVRVLKWFSDQKDSAPRLRKDMKIVDTIRLSNTNSVHLIEVKGKVMLVGCSAGQVSMLGEFDADQLPAQDDPSDNSRFAEYLAKYSGSDNNKTPAGRVAGLLRDCTTYLRSRGLDGSKEGTEHAK